MIPLMYDGRRGAVPAGQLHRTDAQRIEDAWQRFVEFLRARGSRVTEARRHVFLHAARRPGHFSADHVARCLAEGPERVSRATVYHTLALMVDAGFARRVHDGEAHGHYEVRLPGTRHEHLVCRECGRVFEFDEPRLYRVLAAACRRAGFDPISTTVEVLGICEACRAHDAEADSGQAT